MKVIKGNLSQINHIDNLKESVVVIGNFDGLHKYHQKLIHEAERIAHEDNLTLILITFDQSFEDFFRGTNNKILSNQEKLDLVKENFDVDYYLELTVGYDLMNYDKLMFMN
jgi:riboflavin kinase/FMN adenylyltransferase